MQSNQPTLSLNKLKCLLVLCITLAASCCISPAEEAEPQPLPADAQEIREQIGIEDGATHLPGVSLAEGATQLTGVAISPLLGISAVGAWNYFQAPAEHRAGLPWICQPWCWGSCLGILVLLYLSQRAPEPFKTPLKQLETLEDKFSALLAGTAVIPFLVQQVSHYQSLGDAETALVSLKVPLALANMPIFAEISAHWILMPLAIAAFFVIWIVSHAFTVLIALCPIPFIDSLLKAARLALLGSIGALYAISPVLAALFSAIILFICALIAPWACRVTIFGSVISFDFLTSLLRKRPFTGQPVRGFLAKSFPDGFKTRHYGTVTIDSTGEIIFIHRRFLIGPTRTLKLGEATKLCLEKGFPMPSFQQNQSTEDPDDFDDIIHLLPRYRAHSEAIAEHFKLPWRDPALVRGLRAAKTWLLSQFRREKNKGSIANAPSSH